MLWNQHDTRGSGRMAKTITEPRRKIKMDWKDRLFHTINYTAFILFALICFYPFYYLFISTISRNDFVDLGKITFYPIGIHFQNYMLFNGGMIPGYIVISKLGLINSIWALTLPGAMNVSYMILMMNFFRGIPNEIEEAAVIDGANQAQVLFRIYLPMSLPSLATIILFATVANWNVWMDGYMYMNTPDKYPLQTYLATILMESKTNVEALMTPEQLARLSQISQKTIEAAQIFLAALPIMCVYPFLQKYYIKGIVVGSVKG